MNASIDILAAQRIATADAESSLAETIALAEVEPSIFSSVEADHAWGRARMLDEMARQGRSAGPLHGVALAHKDMFDRVGQVVGFGAKAGAGRLASKTSTVLARLDAAGQVDIGRLRMAEYAMSPTGHNHHWGIPRNAVLPGAISGGSSSGSGAAIGAGILRAALGSDTGGSIRLPAACNGVVGLKPTQGRVPMTGVMPLCFTQDTVGPLAATVAEARLILSIIAGPDGLDPACEPVAPPRARGGGILDGLRIGFGAGQYLAPISDSMGQALDTLRRLMSQRGISTVDINLEVLDGLGEVSNTITMSEAAAVHADKLALAPESYGDQLRTRLAQALAMPGFAYVRARQIRQLARRQMFEQVFSDVDCFILPTLHDVPPMAEDLNVGGGQGVSALVSGLARYTRPINLLGFPALSLPVAFTAAGPLSVQIIGPDWSEDLICDVGEWLETALVPVR